ncbi:serine/threonine-protein kinase [Massilia putida]|uniref:serine/threonine-protein kinase n=1 Tax=Massilia putida TaxID=1141883 RepID=UPI000951D1BC|nr:serine/threonine-protein kinase [Massilia putida]
MVATIPPETTGAPDVSRERRHPEQYEYRQRLGEGGFGEVYEAWDTRLQRSVAIKTIRHGGSAGVDLVREARLAASLRHAAFVKVYAVEEDSDGQFIVMELVHGRTLKQALQDDSVSLSTALDWVGQIAEAMRDAHASGLVHGDIKPSNLMVEDDGRVRILDFGLALRHDALATETVSLGSTVSAGQTDPQGTIAYMAPERLQGATPDPRADVYALGVILYELACGKRPFAALHGLALAAALVQTSSDGWDYPDSLDTPLIALIRAMTARQPELRIEGMNEVARRLAELADNEVSRGTKPPTSAARRRPLPRAAKLAAGALLAVTVGGIASWQGLPHLVTLRTTVHQALTPYSEAVEMEQGLAALRLFDRPGALDTAQSHFEHVLARTPDNAAAAAGISLVHSARYGSSDRDDETWLQKADASAQQALRLNDQLALAYVARAAVREGQGRFDDAIAACDRALRLDPANDFAWYIKAETLRRARRYPEARTTLIEASKRFPREHVFLDELGSVEYEQGNDAAAERLFRRSIALEPDAVMAYTNLAATLLRENRADEAARVLQQGLQLRPNTYLYVNLGNVLFLRGDYLGAADAFKNAVSPDHGDPGSYLNWANLGDTLLWIPGRLPEARQAYEKARRLLAPRLERAPHDVLLVSRMGLYSARAGDTPRALELAARAVALSPDSADVLFRAGLSYELLGKRKLALDAIARALHLGYPRKYVEAEPDLVALRRDPNYHAD